MLPTFEFKMHHYGPYSFDLEDAVRILKDSGILDCQVTEHENARHETYTQHDFSLGTQAAVFVRNVGPINADQEQVIEKAVAVFKTRQTRELELLGTVHLVDDLLRQRTATVPSKESVITSVGKIKPRFDQSEIGQAYDELITLGLLGKSAIGTIGVIG